jgi:coenzyme F420-reducing hydrogenase gamma subunit
VWDWGIARPGVTRIKPVCKADCPNRAYDCHTKCETYIKYRAECDAEMKKRGLERVVLGEYADTSERIRKKRRIK